MSMNESGRQVLYEQGCFQRVKIWYEGHQKEINGVLTIGWKGEWLTMVTRDLITPCTVFDVRESSEATN